MPRPENVFRGIRVRRRNRSVSCSGNRPGSGGFPRRSIHVLQEGEFPELLLISSQKSPVRHFLDKSSAFKWNHRKNTGGIPSGFRDEAVALKVEAEETIGPFPRIVHADSWFFGDGGRGTPCFLLRYVEVLAFEIVAVQSPVDAHRPAEKTGSVGPGFDVLNWLDRSYEHGAGLSLPFRHDIHAVVHAVDHVDVGMAGRSEHDSCPWGDPARGMTGLVVGSEIGFYLHDPARSGSPVCYIHQERSQKFFCDNDRITVIE